MNEQLYFSLYFRYFTFVFLQKVSFTEFYKEVKLKQTQWHDTLNFRNVLEFYFDVMWYSDPSIFYADIFVRWHTDFIFRLAFKAQRANLEKLDLNIFRLVCLFNPLTAEPFF